MLTATIAALAILSSAPASIDDLSTRDSYLVEPRPWPTNRVDSPDRPENGRLWHSSYPIGNRTPLAQQWDGRRTSAAYGAPAELNDAVIYTRVIHTPIAISPWRPFDNDGFHDFRHAQNIWLREQGWVLKVRTHVNPMYVSTPLADAGAPTPRATIEVHTDPSAPKFPTKMRVEAPNTRTFKPMSAGAPTVFRVVEPSASEVAMADVEPARD